MLNGQANTTAVDEPAENVQQPLSESTPPQNPTPQQDPSPADEPIQTSVVNKGKTPIADENIEVMDTDTDSSDDEQLKIGKKVSLFENTTGLDFGQNSQGIFPILQIRESEPAHTTASTPVTAEKQTDDMVTVTPQLFKLYLKLLFHLKIILVNNLY